MSSPLVSIIIPTHGRPQYLARAVESALVSMGNDVEIIVVPNGPQSAWQDNVYSLPHDPRIRTHGIETAHANAARNHGLNLARGKYVRFLDDDDYLYPSVAARQYQSLEFTDADLAAASVDIIDEPGRTVACYKLPDIDDLVSATLVPNRNTLPTAYVYRRRILTGMRWDEKLAFNQDTKWMLDLIVSAELNWNKASEISVGVWQTHKGPRVSTKIPPDLRFRTVAAMLDNTAAKLTSQRRMSQQRRKAYSAGLWMCAHMAFTLAPIYWSRVMRRALTMDPRCHLQHPVYTWAGKAGVDPLQLEWLLLPERFLKRKLRRFTNESDDPTRVTRAS